MAYCPHCSAEIRSSDTFCYKCGRPLEIQPENSAPEIVAESLRGSGANVTADARVGQMDVVIAPARIVVVGILSFGTYFFYWFYLTWKHYRNYTRTENYPVWHALTLFVPIYGLYRMHAHVRSFKELMANAGVASSLSPNLGVGLLMISNALSWISFRLAFSDTSPVTMVLDLVAIGVDIGLLVYVQTNLNRYWGNLKDIRVTNARIGVGEVIFILIGILSWIGTVAT